MAGRLANVDLLAVEFNHDVAMQQASGRAQRLIQRILGEEGHLSNAQAAALVRAVIERSAAGRLRHLVQLHLSRECNNSALAANAARAVLDKLPYSVVVHTARQNEPATTISLHTFARGPESGSCHVSLALPPKTIIRSPSSTCTATPRVSTARTVPG